MFYLKEVLYKFLYNLYVFFFLSLIFFVKKDIILVFLNFQFLDNLNNNVALFGSSIMYTSPVELLLVYIKISVLSALFYIVPYLVWSWFDFYKSTFTYSKIKIFTFFYFLNCFILIILIFYSIYIFYPKLWLFFQLLNKTIEQTSFIEFFFQLQFSKYFIFLINFLKIVFYCYLTILSCGLISVLFKFNFLIKFRKLFLLLNGLLATILSPPDVFSQFLFFLALTTITETLLLFFIYYHKYILINFYAGK